MAVPPAIRVTPATPNRDDDSPLNTPALPYRTRSGRVSAPAVDRYRADSNSLSIPLRPKSKLHQQLATPPLSHGDRSPSPSTLERPPNSERFYQTPPEQVKHVRAKPPLQYSLEITPKLRALGKNADNQPENLRLLIEGVRRLIQEKWKVLVIYFNEDCYLPWKKRPWSNQEISKWHIVEFLTDHLEQYANHVEQAQNDGLHLHTRDVDQEFMQLISDLIDLGAATDGEEIFIKEWERSGTLSFFKAREMVARDVY